MSNDNKYPFSPGREDYIAFLILVRYIWDWNIINVLILGILYSLKLTLQEAETVLIDTRLLLHYPTFLLGVCCAKLDLNLEFIRKRKLVLFVAFSVIAVAYLQWIGYSGTSLNKMHLSSTNIAYYGYCLLWTISFVSLAYLISPIAERFSSSVAFLSVISYAVYLFHRPVYGIFYSIVTFWLSNSVFVRTILFPVATLVLVLISYYITHLDTQFLRPRLVKLLNYRD